LYATPSGGRPLLEIQVKQMLNTPPYDSEESRARLKADLAATGIARLADKKVLETVRPNLYLDELTGGRVERLLSIIDRWIEEVGHRRPARKIPDKATCEANEPPPPSMTIGQ